MTSWLERTAFLAAITDPDPVVPAGIRARSPEAAASRIGVYRNNHRSGLIAALSSRFPVTTAIVGDAFFHAMARCYVEGHKPRSPLLMRYGDDFPDFIETFAPAGELSYLPDVTRLEVAVSSAYHTADATALSVVTLPRIAPEDLPDARLTMHPAFRMIHSKHPIGSIWSAHQPGGNLKDVAPGAETVLVTRSAFEIRVASISQPAAAFLEALAAGETVLDANARGVSIDAGFDFGQALVAATAAGCFVAINLGGSQP